MVSGHVPMRFYILADDLISHITGCHGKIAARPPMVAPILPLQLAKFLQQTPTTAAFQPLYQLAHGQMRRHRQQQMHMICRHMATHNIDFQCGTRLSDQFPRSQRHLSPQNRLPVFCHPHYMVFQIVNRVRRFSVAHCPVKIQSLVYHDCYHTVRAGALPSVWRSVHPARSPVKTACLKGRGFDPIYRQ